MKVAVLAYELQVVLGGELADRLALRVGREALPLLLGRLAHVSHRPLAEIRRHGELPLAHASCVRRRVVGRAGATNQRTSGRTLRLRGAAALGRHWPHLS